MIKRSMIIAALLLATTWTSSWSQESSVLIQQARVVRRPISETLTVYGQVAPDPDTVQTISLLHDALVTRVAVRPGQRVKDGETLLELATSPGAHMAYLKARAAVDFAQRELARQQRLMAEQLSTKAQVESAQNALQDARRNLQALEAQGQNKAIVKVFAPAAGIIIRLNAKQGDRLQVGAALMEMAIGSRLVAVLGVEPEDIRLLAPGTPVTLRSVFVPGYHAQSRLGEIHAIINPATRLVDALAPIPADQADQLVLGGSLTADIRLHAHTGLTVPRSAVLQDDQGAFVFRIVDGRGHRTAVTTGLQSDQWVEIVSGLKAGEAVVVTGNYELRDGMPVREGR